MGALWAGGAMLAGLLVAEPLKRDVLRRTLETEHGGQFKLDEPVCVCAIYFPLLLVDGLDGAEFIEEFITATGAPLGFDGYATAMREASQLEDPLLVPMRLMSERVHSLIGHKPTQDRLEVCAWYQTVTSSVTSDFRAVGLGGPPESQIGQMLVMAANVPSRGLWLSDVRKYLRS